MFEHTWPCRCRFSSSRVNEVGHKQRRDAADSSRRAGWLCRCRTARRSAPATTGMFGLVVRRRDDPGHLRLAVVVESTGEISTSPRSGRVRWWITSRSDAHSPERFSPPGEGKIPRTTPGIATGIWRRPRTVRARPHRTRRVDVGVTRPPIANMNLPDANMYHPGRIRLCCGAGALRHGGRADRPTPATTNPCPHGARMRRAFRLRVAESRIHLPRRPRVGRRRRFTRHAPGRLSRLEAAHARRYPSRTMISLRSRRRFRGRHLHAEPDLARAAPVGRRPASRDAGGRTSIRPTTPICSWSAIAPRSPGSRSVRCVRPPAVSSSPHARVLVLMRARSRSPRASFTRAGQHGGQRRYRGRP